MTYPNSEPTGVMRGAENRGKLGILNHRLSFMEMKTDGKT